jgi:hypothetical protein
MFSPYLLIMIIGQLEIPSNSYAGIKSSRLGARGSVVSQKRRPGLITLAFQLLLDRVGVSGRI